MTRSPGTPRDARVSVKRSSYIQDVTSVFKRSSKMGDAGEARPSPSTPSGSVGSTSSSPRTSVPAGTPATLASRWARREAANALVHRAGAATPRPPPSPATGSSGSSGRRPLVAGSPLASRSTGLEGLEIPSESLGLNWGTCGAAGARGEPVVVPRPVGMARWGEKSSGLGIDFGDVEGGPASPATTASPPGVVWEGIVERAVAPHSRAGSVATVVAGPSCTAEATGTNGKNTRDRVTSSGSSVFRNGRQVIFNSSTGELGYASTKDPKEVEQVLAKHPAFAEPADDEPRPMSELFDQVLGDWTATDRGTTRTGPKDKDEDANSIDSQATVRPANTFTPAFIQWTDLTPGQKGKGKAVATSANTGTNRVSLPPILTQPSNTPSTTTASSSATPTLPSAAPLKAITRVPVPPAAATEKALSSPLSTSSTSPTPVATVKESHPQAATFKANQTSAATVKAHQTPAATVKALSSPSSTLPSPFSPTATVKAFSSLSSTLSSPLSPAATVKAFSSLSSTLSSPLSPAATAKASQSAATVKAPITASPKTPTFPAATVEASQSSAAIVKAPATPAAIVKAFESTSPTSPTLHKSAATLRAWRSTTSLTSPASSISPFRSTRTGNSSAAVLKLAASHENLPLTPSGPSFRPIHADHDYRVSPIDPNDPIFQTLSAQGETEPVSPLGSIDPDEEIASSAIDMFKALESPRPTSVGTRGLKFSSTTTIRSYFSDSSSDEDASKQQEHAPKVEKRTSRFRPRSFSDLSALFKSHKKEPKRFTQQLETIEETNDPSTELTSSKMTSARQHFKLPALVPVSHGPNSHPEHPFNWHAKKLYCISHQGQCPVCGSSCCKEEQLKQALKHDMCGMEDGGMAGVMKGMERLWKLSKGGNGIETFDTFLQCTQCHKKVCPACIGFVGNGIEKDLLCKLCRRY
ncbi:hypothetical protein C1H76_9363 [Elsinoe australis]|uniref:Uncharacterized protein n=1 Tax=Elsinoe australis TaxID=40998 RepID=A0A4U7AKS5_9PEZI|nr:hypothetical protein C1H76_9363 [Elsinoe australis]